MKEYDVIVIGSGAGLDIVELAVEHGKKTALIDKGPAGGTCLNVGCVPSKMMIFPADRIMEIRGSAKLGINAGIQNIDFKSIMNRMRQVVKSDHDKVKHSLKGSKDLDYYEERAEFVGEYTLKVGDETIKAAQIYIAAGTRPLIPPLKGIEKVEYLTNETLLNLDSPPKSLIVVGGGYIGVEFAHFFETMGTEVTVLEAGSRLVPSEEPEISAFLQMALSRRITVHTDCPASSLEARSDGGVTVKFKYADTGQEGQIQAGKVLIAAGRRSNADLLKVEKSAIALDDQGFIKVNDRMETNVKGIYAIGDANGKELFTHTSHFEAEIAAANGIHGQDRKMSYRAAPHAVFTYPQIASVGLTELEASRQHKILVGRADYLETTYGTAMLENEGFVKVILEQESGKILGAHIIGPWASVLIQEVTNAMATGGGLDEIASGIHIHPALSEVVVKALFNAVPVN